MYKIHPIIYKFHEFNGDMPLLIQLYWGEMKELILVRFRKDKPAAASYQL